MKTKCLLCFLLMTIGLSPHSQAISARENLLLTASAARKQAASQPHRFRDLPVFDVASAKTIAGAGFFVSSDGRILAVTAKHPHEGTLPKEFVGATNRFRLKDKVHDADDVLAFSVETGSIPVFQLVSRNSRLLRAGDALAVVSHDGVLSGKLTGWNLSMDELLLPGQSTRGKLQLLIPGKHELQGNSGAPVVLEETGEVVGILTDCVTMERETSVDFELLTLERTEPRQGGTPPTVFSLKPVGTASGNEAELGSKLFPPEIFACVPGMNLTNLLEQRPFLPSVSAPGLHGRGYGEFFSSYYLFHEVVFTANQGRVTQIEFFQGLTGAPELTGEKIHSLFNWFFATLGQPSEAFAFGEHRNRPDYLSVYCQWTNSQANVILGATSSSQSRVYYVTLRAFSSELPRSKIMQESWSDLESLRRAVIKLSGKQERNGHPENR